MPIILFTLMIFSLGGLMYANFAELFVLSFVLKFSTSFLFVLIAIFGYKKHRKNAKFFYLILIGLIFSVLGDVFLAIHNNDVTFILGLLSFSLAHILYSIGFCYVTRLSLRDIAMFIGIATPTVCFVVFKDGFDYGTMLPFVISYIILISFMVAKAFSFTKIWQKNKFQVTLIIVGAVLFYISDFILLYAFFYKQHFEILLYLNFLVYYFAQGFLALSFKKPLELDK